MARKSGKFYSKKSMNPESHHEFHIFSFQSSKWKALQDVDVGAMGRRKSNFLPFEEIFSHDRDKSAPGPPQIIPGGDRQEGIFFEEGNVIILHPFNDFGFVDTFSYVLNEQ